MTIYVLVILIAVGLAQVYFLVRLQRGAMDLMRIEERAGRLDTAVHVLTDTCETGFRSIAREIGRAPVEMSPAPKKSANRRLRTAAGTGQSIAAIAAAERMSEGEVRLRLQLPPNGRRAGTGNGVGPAHRGANGNGQGYANGDGYRGGNGYRNGDVRDDGHRAGHRGGRREVAEMHFEDDLLYDPDFEQEQEPEMRPARQPRAVAIPRNAAALRGKQQAPPPQKQKQKKKKKKKARVAEPAASVAPKKVTAVRNDTDVITNGHTNGNGNGTANGNGHLLAHDQTDGHGGDTGMGVESDGGPKEGKSRGTVRPS
jgi:hypothetical protein